MLISVINALILNERSNPGETGCTFHWAGTDCRDLFFKTKKENIFKIRENLCKSVSKDTFKSTYFLVIYWWVYEQD